MTAFNLATSYANDWQFHDFVEENGKYYPPTTGNAATEAVFGLKVKRDRKAVSAAFGGEIAFNGTTEGLLVWHPTNSAGKLLPFEPAVDGKFVLSDSEWTIDEIDKSKFGVYAIVVIKARENAQLT